MERGDELLAAVISKRFDDEDEQSTLFDRYERLSFEAHLNKAMHLARSLSQPGEQRAPPPPSRGGNRSSFRKVVKKLLSPILGRKAEKGEEGPRPSQESWKKFSRSLRF